MVSTRRVTVLFFLLFLLLSIVPISADSHSEFGTNWTAEYFNNTTLSGVPVFTESMPMGINVNWGTGSPNPAVPVDNFSARFTSVQLFNAGTYEFIVSSDDGVRIFVDNLYVWDRFVGRVLTTDRFQVTLKAGTHALTVEYLELIDQAAIQFQYFQVSVNPSGINGHVSNAQGADVAGVTVSAYNASTATFAYRINTDQNGDYSLSLDTGVYRIVAEHVQYATEFYNGKYNFWSADDVVVNNQGFTENIDFVLEYFGCISGRVTYPDGVTPATRNQVYVFRAGNPPESSYYDATTYGITDDSGNYNVCNLVPGQYRVEAYDPTGTYPHTFYNGKFTPADAPLITVDSGATTSNINFSYLTYGSNAPMLTSPVGYYDATPPTFNWNADAGADWHHVWLSGQDGTVFERWYDDGMVCSAGACSVPSDIVLPSGSYRWWVQTWNSVTGYSEWSPPGWFYMNFQGAPTPITPIGTISGTTPNFTWEKLPGATWYEVWISPPEIPGTSYWVSASSACSGNSCFTSPLVIGQGLHRWWVRGWSEDLGYSEWSAETRAALPPAAPSPIAPLNATDTPTPTFQWTAVLDVEWYYLRINNANGVLFGEWYSPSICSGGVCSLPSPLALPDGDYTWWVLGWNSMGGYGAWSVAGTFTVLTAEATPDFPGAPPVESPELPPVDGLEPPLIQ